MYLQLLLSMPLMILLLLLLLQAAEEAEVEELLQYYASPQPSEPGYLYLTALIYLHFLSRPCLCRAYCLGCLCCLRCVCCFCCLCRLWLVLFVSARPRV